MSGPFKMKGYPLHKTVALTQDDEEKVKKTHSEKRWERKQKKHAEKIKEEPWYSEARHGPGAVNPEQAAIEKGKKYKEHAGASRKERGEFKFTKTAGKRRDVEYNPKDKLHKRKWVDVKVKGGYTDRPTDVWETRPKVKKKGYEKVITKKGGKTKTKWVSEKKAARQIERKRKKAYSEAEHFKASDYYKEERKKHDAEYGEGSFDKQFQ